MPCFCIQQNKRAEVKFSKYEENSWALEGIFSKSWALSAISSRSCEFSLTDSSLSDGFSISDSDSSKKSSSIDSLNELFSNF